jgi:RimJ/RimL family protein N-acetyltransferase
VLALQTERCVLRPWRASDAPLFAAINADPQVMRYFPAPLTRGESDALLARIVAHFDAHGFGLWALEIVGACTLAGFVGLARTSFDAWFTPCVEVGWRLAPSQWGKGYATEAARAVLSAGFDRFGLEEIVSFTAASNRPSWQLMQRLGMQPEGAFEHPRLPGHALAHHLLYKITRPQFERARAARAG